MYLKKIRLILAVCACKAAVFFSRLLGKKGSSAPGKLALKICPSAIFLLSRQVKGSIIAVCGTNGKTTTNNLLYSLLSSDKKRVVCNNLGANMLYGVCCAFCTSASIFGRLNADYAAIEVDEASAVKVFPQLLPDKMVITNLFRDQLDRYGEIDITIDYIKRALALSPKTELILNGDDPLCAQFGKALNRKSFYLSVDENVGISLNEMRDGSFCTFCGAKLDYEYYHYSQLGKYKCPSCGFIRPEPDFRVYNVKLGNSVSFSMDYFGNTQNFSVHYRGFYNIYNIALSYAASYLATGGNIKNYEAVFNGYRPQIGRMEEFCINNKPVILNLSKNPAGFNQTISAVGNDERKKALLIVINDNAQDGKDISWLWDVDFERLKNVNASKIILAGLRTDDMAVRLKYAGISPQNFVKAYDLKNAAELFVKEKGEVFYALVNYTAVFKMQEIFKELEK